MLMMSSARWRFNLRYSRNEIIQQFKSLIPKQQEFILDEIVKKTTGIFSTEVCSI